MDKLKEIVAVFIKSSPDLINENTLIDRTAIQGSILIHRMYAEIEKAGYKIDDYSDIHTFGDILKVLEVEKHQVFENKTQEAPNFILPNIEKNMFNIGIDIEEVSNFNLVDDFREDNFYKQNFSDKEISYCVLQANILHSFAGKFAAKEAIIKADNYYKGSVFNKIEILNHENGKPYFGNFELSVSHTGNLAVAVAVKGQPALKTINGKNDNKQNQNNKMPLFIAVFALIIAFASLFFSIFP